MNERINKTNGVILISTFSDEKSLIDLSKLLIMEKKICACVNYTKVNSMYIWDSKLQCDEEYLAFFKTTSTCIKNLKDEIMKNHPYEIPEIVVIHMSDVSDKYLSWMIGNTNN